MNQRQLRRAEQSLHFASIPTNFSIFIILLPRPRTYASTSPLLLLQLHQQQQLLSIINIINSTHHHLQHAKLRILLQHLTSHAVCERSGGPPKRPAAKRPCTYYSSLGLPRVLYNGKSQTVCLSDPPLQRLRTCLLYTSPSPRDQRGSRMPSSA